MAFLQGFALHPQRNGHCLLHGLAVLGGKAGDAAHQRFLQRQIPGMLFQILKLGLFHQRLGDDTHNAAEFPLALQLRQLLEEVSLQRSQIGHILQRQLGHMGIGEGGHHGALDGHHGGLPLAQRHHRTQGQTGQPFLQIVETLAHIGIDPMQALVIRIFQRHHIALGNGAFHGLNGSKPGSHHSQLGIHFLAGHLCLQQSRGQRYLPKVIQLLDHTVSPMLSRQAAMASAS